MRFVLISVMPKMQTDHWRTDFVVLVRLMPTNVNINRLSRAQKWGKIMCHSFSFKTFFTFFFSLALIIQGERKETKCHSLLCVLFGVRSLIFFFSPLRCFHYIFNGYLASLTLSFMSRHLHRTTITTASINILTEGSSFHLQANFRCQTIQLLLLNRY